MANKRDLKKQIRYICGDIAVECMIAAETVKDIDIKAFAAVIDQIAELQTNALHNATFSFDKIPADFESRAAYNKAASAYYKKAYKSFNDDFNTQLQTIVKAMNNLLPRNK